MAVCEDVELFVCVMGVGEDARVSGLEGEAHSPEFPKVVGAMAEVAKRSVSQLGFSLW